MSEANETKESATQTGSLVSANSTGVERSYEGGQKAPSEDQKDAQKGDEKNVGSAPKKKRRRGRPRGSKDKRKRRSRRAENDPVGGDGDSVDRASVDTDTSTSVGAPTPSRLGDLDVSGETNNQAKAESTPEQTKAESKVARATEVKVLRVTKAKEEEEEPEKEYDPYSFDPSTQTIFGTSAFSEVPHVGAADFPILVKACQAAFKTNYEGAYAIAKIAAPLITHYAGASKPSLSRDMMSLGLMIKLNMGSALEGGE